MAEIKIGVVVVRVKGQYAAPKMTVCSEPYRSLLDFWDHPGGCVEVVWFINYHLCRDTFPTAVLEKAP